MTGVMISLNRCAVSFAAIKSLQTLSGTELTECILSLDAHNHFPHSVLSRYAFGAPPKLIHDCWNHDKRHLVSLDPAGPDRKDVDETKVPKRITRKDWGNYLGNKG